MTHLPLQLFPHILGMIREQHTKHHSHRRGRGGGQQRGACHLCGGTDHWKNECPSQQGDGQFTGPPAGGWGPLRGGPGGRGRGPYTSRYPGQQHPSPANLQVPMHPTWGPEGDAGDC